jgi:glucose/mannose transport system permease protein
MKGWSIRSQLQRHAAAVAVAPSVAAVTVFVYGFIAWTCYVSVSASTMLPNYRFVGLLQYRRLWANPLWNVAVSNVLLFSLLFISITTLLGLGLAILLDQRIRFEGVLRLIYLYPMALSFVVTGTAWKWILNPGLGIEHLVRSWGWQSFTFDWLVNEQYALYTIILAGVWQASGFVMALYLAGLRAIDEDVVKAARLDGASGLAIYRRVMIPQLGPTTVTVIVVLMQQAIKTYDLVVALTGGGPANSTHMPATFMYSETFQRSEMGIGSASAVMLLMTIFAIVVPYLYATNRKSHHE